MPMVCLSVCPVGETEAREKEGPAAHTRVCPQGLLFTPPPLAVARAGADPPDKQVQDIGDTGDVSFQAAVF